MGESRTVVVVATVVLVLAMAACGGDEGRDGALVVDDPASVEADYEYVIPLGTGARFDAGEAVEILPGAMVVQVGEVMRIINEDDRSHQVGPFFIGADETLTQRFASVGEFTGLCTVHPSGEFVLTVTD